MSSIVPNGTKVKVNKSTFISMSGSRAMVGSIGTIRHYDSSDCSYRIRPEQGDPKEEFWFNRDDFTIINEPTSITIDGINYNLTKKTDQFSWGEVVIASNTKGIVSGDVDSRGRIPVLFSGSRSIRMMSASSVTKTNQTISI